MSPATMNVSQNRGRPDSSRKSIRRKWSAFFPIALVVLMIFVVSCSQTPSAGGRSVLNVGMILGTGGLGDKSFNDSAYSGLLRAQKSFNIRFETADFSSKQSNLDALRLFAQSKYDLIIGIGFENQESIATVAREYPQIRFATIDVVTSGDNVASVVYREHEGDFLMGVLAASLTKTNKVGIIGGMDIDTIRRIEKGFRQGVRYQNSNVSVISNIAGTFSDPQAGKALALAQYTNGADIIHNAAGRTGLGIIEAARESGKLTTGTSGDQRYLAPGNVVGNRPKRVDTAVFMLVEEINSGKFAPVTRSLGLKEDGISLGPFDEALVPKATMDRLERLKRDIIEGRIFVQVE